ncbi:GH92 family glycosyl hydrolase [Alkaliflexus imshenetskii]|uniref:GH92 family glycosyl hydrolase n=1 Tax=Alkaliflexus imshenetskii TaxID=286730 RepID=UPI0005C4C2E1|nr:GH92 family glycosyl hydrolase [Alkaliflexus imshenetskii]
MQRLYGLIIGITLSLLLYTGCDSPSENGKLLNLMQYVDQYIGTGEHGHVFIGANVPFGFVQLGPTQHSQGWDWCSGYHYSDSTIIGFGHLHLSGTGIGDLGDVSFMPVIGRVKTTRGELPDEASGIYSYFRRETEKASPGYYAVTLDRFGIHAELTTTKRVGFHKYTFPASDEAGVIIDLEHGIGWDRSIDSYIVMDNDSTVSGYRRSMGWARNQVVYFTAVFSKPMKDFAVFNSTQEVEGESLNAEKVYGHAFFEIAQGESLLVKVGLSPVSIDNARMNLNAELPGWDFEAAVKSADDEWNKQLNKIVIETDNDEYKRVFYTALYHTMVAPSVFQDVNGDYHGSDFKIHNDKSYKNFTTLSLWDTYRAAHPLMTIIHPEMVSDVAQTMINIYKQQGKLPVWHLMGNETDCMVGNPAIPVLADAILKGFNIDAEEAYKAIFNTSMLDERGLDLYKEYGYIPFDKHIERETAAMTLEYALADWSAAQVAYKLGYDNDYNYFKNRSKAYQYLFDTSTGFMRGKSSAGEFRSPFDPFRTVHMGDDFCEGNAWQYVWLVPHDVKGLVNLFGSEALFVSKLDSLFIVDGDMGEDASADITGLIGQYAHGNEPSHHVAYLYAYVGQPWKTAQRVHEILTTMYDDTPSGLCGNEDVGQMSAWYVLSSLGFYQVEPAGGKYIFGRPLFNKADILLKDGQKLSIVAHNNSDENMYIQSIKLNGKNYTKSFINHKTIKEGGTLEFFMGSHPSDVFGVGLENRP